MAEVLKPAIHGRDHRPGGGADETRYAVWHIALTGDRDDDDVVVAENNVIRPVVSLDMDTYRLEFIQLGLGVASSSGAVSIMVENETRAVDMLSTAASLGAGSQYADQASVIAARPDNEVSTGDVIAIHITAAGTDAKGLKAILTFR